MNKLNFLWGIPALFLSSVVVGALGGNTIHYQCKYVDKVEVRVADHEKYATALYTIKYSDGTTGVTSDVDNSGPVGISKGTACKTVFNYGFPYQFTNHKIADESQVKK